MLKPLFSSQTDQQQNLALFKLYTGYRTLLSVVLLATFLYTDTQFVGSHNPGLFFYTVCTYLAINLITLIVVIPKQNQFSLQFLFVSFFIDTVATVLITDASNGINSGIEILLVAIVAAASIMLPMRLALLIASLASLMIIADTISLINNRALQHSSLVPSGLIGFILFITVYIITNLTKRIRSATEVAEQRAVDVGKLQQLNREIIQRMRTGIVVTNSSGYIKMANEAAAELLGNKHLSQAYKAPHSNPLPSTLSQQLAEWMQFPQYHMPTFRATETGPEIQASFSALNKDQQEDILIFLENNHFVTQRAQQIKLASLGRLTASIAHEIRNPLSAVSHASQLLDESDELNEADRRLADIIQNHCLRMNQIIENVVQLSQRKAPKSEKIFLHKYLENFINEYTQGNHNHPCNITLTYDSDTHIAIVDTSQLHQVITNLVDNGLRYSYQHTNQATLKFNVQINPVTHLPVLDIIDDGMGVSEEHRELLFEPFHTTETKGTGLGLYISRELCEANQARLDYIRTNEGKSCFRISFPHPERRLSSEKVSTINY